ncbi:hypothetical protein DN757_01490 [Paenibacillus silvae]|uniref:Uncharacterized protein n=1 Tax=Paenibacillus silvae TaxID=1325358 RepID=A0A2W6PGR7_9BACL|nr:hypothetical protein DN757_01490 [Paenibacillus silvae]
MSNNGIFIFDINKDEQLKECFISELQNLMAKYRVYNFKGEFNNDTEFSVSDFWLQGSGSSFYDFCYREPKSE